MNQRSVVAEIREIWCKNAVTSSRQHKVQGLGLTAWGSPTATLITIKARVNPLMLCNFMGYFYRVKKTEIDTWRRVWFYEAPLKMLLLNSGQKWKEGVLLSLVSFCPWHWLGQLLHPFPDGFMAILRCNEAVNDAWWSLKLAASWRQQRRESWASLQPQRHQRQQIAAAASGNIQLPASRGSALSLALAPTMK